jgi:phosphoenolpyruvate-protein kinase (PTS system EI component)
VTAIQGIGISPGRAIGPAVLLSVKPAEPIEDPVRALELVADELEELASGLDGEMAEILLAQAAIARDPELSAAADKSVEAGHLATEAIRIAAEPYRTALAGARSEYQRERAADVAEVVARAGKRIEGSADSERTPPIPGILVSAIISPADTATVPLAHLLGMVSAEGGVKSHVAIVARSLGVPAVSGIDPLALSTLSPGQGIEIDGTAGTIEVLAGQPRSPSRRRTVSDNHDTAPAPDRSNHDIRANLGSVAEAELAANLGLTSVGLVRTEFLLADRSALDVDRQVELYRELLDRLPGTLIFRLLDIGADKPHASLPMLEASNPALGMRGARLLLRNPELLENQVRALCRLGQSDRVSVMVPMVTRVEELERVRAVVERVFDQEGIRLPLGSMIEVPAAALAARELAEESDFLSVGTNDLLQYLFAADRGLPELDSLVEPLPPTVWGLLRSVMRAARDADISIGVCGELAADPALAGALFGLGADYISVGPSSAPEVRAALASKTPEQWAAFAGQLGERTAAEVEAERSDRRGGRVEPKAQNVTARRGS